MKKFHENYFFLQYKMGGTSSRNIQKYLDPANRIETPLAPKFQEWHCYGSQLVRLAKTIGHYAISIQKNLKSTLSEKEAQDYIIFYNSLRNMGGIFNLSLPPISVNTSEKQITDNIYKIQRQIKEIKNKVEEVHAVISSESSDENIKASYIINALCPYFRGIPLNYHDLNEYEYRINKVAGNIRLRGSPDNIPEITIPKIQTCDIPVQDKVIGGGFQWSSPMGKAILIAIVIFLVVIIFVQLWRFRGQKKEIKTIEDTYRGWRGL